MERDEVLIDDVFGNQEPLLDDEVLEHFLFQNHLVHIRRELQVEVSKVVHKLESCAELLLLVPETELVLSLVLDKLHEGQFIHATVVELNIQLVLEVFKNNVEIIEVVGFALLKILDHTCLNELAVSSKLDLLIDFVRVEDVSDLNMSVAEEGDEIWTGHLDLDHEVAPLNLLVLKIIHAIQVKIKAGVVPGNDEGFQELVKYRPYQVGVVLLTLLL